MLAAVHLISASSRKSMSALDSSSRSLGSIADGDAPVIGAVCRSRDSSAG